MIRCFKQQAPIAYSLHIICTFLAYFLHICLTFLADIHTNFFYLFANSFHIFAHSLHILQYSLHNLRTFLAHAGDEQGFCNKSLARIYVLFVAAGLFNQISGIVHQLFGTLLAELINIFIGKSLLVRKSFLC